MSVSVSLSDSAHQSYTCNLLPPPPLPFPRWCTPPSCTCSAQQRRSASAGFGPSGNSSCTTSTCIPSTTLVRGAGDILTATAESRCGTATYARACRPPFQPFSSPSNPFRPLPTYPGVFDDKDKHWSCCKQPSKDIKGCQPAHDYAARRRKEAARPSEARGSLGNASVRGPPQCHSLGQRVPLALVSTGLRSPSSSTNQALGTSGANSKRTSSVRDAGDGLRRKLSKTDLLKSVLKTSENVQPIVVKPSRTSYV